jgi:hypothetical protein
MSEEELIRRLRGDLVDSYDEEIELELEDRSLDELEGRHVTDRAERQALFQRAVSPAGRAGQAAGLGAAHAQEGGDLV